MIAAKRKSYILISAIVWAQAAFGQNDKASLQASVPYMPDFMMMDGKSTVFYELILTNVSDDPIELNKIEVLHKKDSTVAVSMDENQIAKKSNQSVQSDHHEEWIPPGSSRLVYIEVSIAGENLSLQLFHRIHFQQIRNGGKESKHFYGAIVEEIRETNIVLAPPVRNGSWVAVYEPSWQRGHRRVVYTVGGKDRIPGRFAIDFIKVDSMGRYANGDSDSIQNWYGYGDEVLAVADGVVESVRDDFNESMTLSKHPKYSSEKATGNYVSVNIGDNRIAFYEHLKPGSIKVKRGQVVKKGDVIALIGFTGQTTGPHLHFHVADKDSPLGAEGISFVFNRFAVLGVYDRFEVLGRAKWSTHNKGDKTATNERPAPNSVIEFYHK